MKIKNKEKEKAKEIEIENVSKRKGNRSVFMTGFKKNKAIYSSSPRRYKVDENEGFIDVEDGEIIENEVNNCFSADRGLYRANFSKSNDTGEIFTVEKDHYRLTFSSKRDGRSSSCNVSATRGENNKVVFSNISDDTDLEYEAKSNRVKENIVIHKATGVYRYPFIVKADNLTIHASETERCIRFMSTETDEEIFKIPAPFMRDSAGENSHRVFYEVKQLKEDSVLITVVADTEWINAEDRVFPVVIDPQVVLGGTEDIETFSWYDGYISNSETHTVATLGETDGDCNSKRMYIRVKHPSIGELPNIKRANLIVYQQESLLTSEKAPRIGLYKVSDNIVIGKCTPAFELDLVDYAVMQPGTTDSNGDTIKYSFDITNIFDMQMADEAQNTTRFVIRVMDESSEDRNMISLYGSTGILSPELEVSYNSAYSTESCTADRVHQIGFFGTGSINLERGNLKFNCPIFNWKGNRMPVTISQTYNSVLGQYQYTNNEDIDLHTADFSGMNMGIGWKLNLFQSIIPCNFVFEGELCSGYVYMNENGIEHYFIEGVREESRVEQSDEYPAHYLYEDLESGYTFDNLKYELNKYGEIYKFDSTGKLYQITNEYGDSITITYTEGRITSVTDGVGREFFFDYTSDGYLSTITAPDNSQISYTYTSNRLTNITYPDGVKAHIYYTRQNYPRKIALQDSTEKNLYAVEYEQTGRDYTLIKEYGYDGMYQYLGNSTTFEYNRYANTTIETTQMIDESTEETISMKTVYCFDDNGNVINKYQYEDESEKTGVEFGGSGINPYSGSGYGVISNVDNMLKNHNFTSMDHWIAESTNCENTACTSYPYQSYALYGNTVLKIETEYESAVANGVYQTTGVLKAGDYTFSVYARAVTRPEGSVEAPGIYLKVTDAAGSTLSESEHDNEFGRGFTRHVVSFTLTEDSCVNVHILMDGKFMLYADAAQLEKCEYANDYNLIVDSNFELGSDAWNMSNGVFVSDQDCFNMTKSLCIVGDLDSVRYAYQSLNVKTYPGTRETFTLSGWAKGYAIPDHERAGAEEATFRIKARFLYDDNTVEDHVADFNSGCCDWQLASVSFSKNEFKTVQSLDISCEYDHNYGEAFFDNIQLVRTDLEVGLKSSDFKDDFDGNSSFDDGSEDIELNSEMFEDVYDRYGNAITYTRFSDYDVGAFYTSYGYNTDDPSTDLDDAGNHKVRETDNRGNAITYSVDPCTSRDTSVTDRCGTVTEYTYTHSGEKETVTKIDTDGTVLNTYTYTFSPLRKVNYLSRGDSMKYDIAYTPFGNLKSISLENTDVPLVSYSYGNNNGRIKEIAYANGWKITIAYNKRGKISEEKCYSPSGEVTGDCKYMYDGRGVLIKTLDIFNKKEYTYTYSDGKPTKAVEYDIELSADSTVISRIPVNTVHFKYDSEGRLDAKVITCSDGSDFVYKYEENDRTGTVTSFSSNGKVVRSHSRKDGFGRKEFEEISLSTGYVNRRFTYYDGVITEEHIEHKKIVSNPITSLVKEIKISDGRTLTYEYDGEDRITKVTDSLEGVTEYTYDALGQLLTETVNGNRYAYEYDSYGNILRAYILDEDGGVSANNEIVYTYGNPAWKDLVTEYCGRSITYDKQGNPTEYLGHILTWEKGRHLKTFDSNIYEYNAKGIRISKTVNGVAHKYTLDGINILRETWGENTLIPLYDNENTVCGILYNDVPFYFIKNLQNDIIAITDDCGNTVVRYRYDAWGVCFIVQDTSSCNIANINPFRYRSYYYDSEISMYYLQSRYYDPYLCRFINADEPIIGVVNEYNLFAYCKNMPVICDDPLGDKTRKAILITIPEFADAAYLDYEYSLKDCFSDDIVDFTKVVVDNFGKFSNAWKRASDYDILIIDSHANPFELLVLINGERRVLLNKWCCHNVLTKSSVKFIVLTGCSAGQVNPRGGKYNIAQAIQFRTNKACVIANDGVGDATSKGDTPNRKIVSFYSRENENWEFYGVRENKGWVVIYGNNKMGVMHKKILTFKSMFKFVLDHNLVPSW